MTYTTTENYTPLSKEALATLRGGYLLPGESPDTLYQRLAKTSAGIAVKMGLFSYEESIDYYGDLLHILRHQWLGPASPVASNFGTNRGLPISCYGVHLSDSTNSIFSHLKETAAMSKLGGGVGVNLEEIRPLGAPISTGGHSNGVVPWARLYDLQAQVVSQGGVRRGSFAFYLPIDHPDLKELLLSKDHTKGDPRQWIYSNIAVTITDSWMEKLVKGSPSHLELWNLVLKTRLQSGSPYLLFIDNVNNANPRSYNLHNLKVSTSNLCLGGDTSVMVRFKSPDGTIGRPISKTIKDLANAHNDVLVFNGEQWVPCTGFRQTGNNVPLMRVWLSNGTYVDCTYYHRWPVKGRMTEARNLLVGDQLQTSLELEGEFVTISKISPVGNGSVYCTTVPDGGIFTILKGILTGNCSEIALYTDESHSFVCCLSSLNLAKWMQWCDWIGVTGWSVPFLATIFLDTVMEDFIQKGSRETSMGRAVRSATKGRPLGLGVMGLHLLYQQQMLPFVSEEACKLNVEIHSRIKSEAVEASKYLASKLGEPAWCEGTGFRNTHLLAVAPTRTNAVISGAFSQGIEPIDANYFVAKQSKTTFPRKNPVLETLLQNKGFDTSEVWESILANEGSVSHLEFLTPQEKEVFLTAREIDQISIIRQAAERNQYICQAQSINLFFHPYVSSEYLNFIHFLAWKSGVKSLYYVKSKSPQALKRPNVLITRSDCPWCHKLKEQLAVDGLADSYEEMSVLEAKTRGLWTSDMRTVPQFIVNGESVGGYTDYVGIKESSSFQSDCTACEG